MNGCCFVDVETVRCQDLADPEIEQGTDAVVQVSMAGLCGSDLHPYFGRELGLEPGTVMGHEFVGQVIAVGPDVHKIKVGDRVACPFSTNCGQCFYCLRGLTSRCERGQLLGWRQKSGETVSGLHGGQSERIRVPQADGSLLQLADSVSDPMALLLGDNLSTAWYCASMADIDPNGSCLVIGCGTVGLLTVLAAKEMGANRILAFDLDEHRRSIAESMGARAFSDEARLMSEIGLVTSGRGVDSVMELVGLLPAQKLAWRAIRPGGTLSTIGCHCTPNFGFSPADAYDKNLTYRTGRCPARAFMDTLLPVVERLTPQAEPLVSHHFSVTEASRAYEVFGNRRENCLKAVFQFS